MRSLKGYGQYFAGANSFGYFRAVKSCG